MNAKQNQENLSSIQFKAIVSHFSWEVLEAWRLCRREIWGRAAIARVLQEKEDTIGDWINSVDQEVAYVLGDAEAAEQLLTNHEILESIDFDDNFEMRVTEYSNELWDTQYPNQPESDAFLALPCRSLSVLLASNFGEAIRESIKARLHSNDVRIQLATLKLCADAVTKDEELCQLIVAECSEDKNEAVRRELSSILLLAREAGSKTAKEALCNMSHDASLIDSLPVQEVIDDQGTDLVAMSRFFSSQPWSSPGSVAASSTDSPAVSIQCEPNEYQIDMIDPLTISPSLEDQVCYAQGVFVANECSFKAPKIEIQVSFEHESVLCRQILGQVRGVFRDDKWIFELNSTFAVSSKTNSPLFIPPAHIGIHVDEK